MIDGGKIVCTYKFFTGDRIWKSQTSELSLLWFTDLIFIHYNGQCSPPTPSAGALEHQLQPRYTLQRTHRLGIHNMPSGYMDHYGWV